MAKWINDLSTYQICKESAMKVVKTALVTGSSSGIGYGIAKVLLQMMRTTEETDSDFFINLTFPYRFQMSNV